MSKHLYLVLGNGFTIDLLRHLGVLEEEVDVSNLFRHGSYVPWPGDSEPGFLSFKRCPNLWNLGARPNMKREEAVRLIEDIITCVNVYASLPGSHILRDLGRSSKPNDIYLLAYKELAAYLKHLFIFYDGKVKIDQGLCNWSWSAFFCRIHESNSYSRVTVVTYNYDIWLERLLTMLQIPFNIACVEKHDATAKINIVKPHGSIGFAHEKALDRDAFRIRTDREMVDAPMREFQHRLDDLDANYLVSALIPPAGESARLQNSWASEIRREAKRLAGALSESDEMIVCGLSYWHVDRAELDEILTSCNPRINLKMVNPNPERALDAVITSIFDNYVSYPSSKALEKYLI